jgi:hypothetical protein
MSGKDASLGRDGVATLQDCSENWGDADDEAVDVDDPEN